MQDFLIGNQVATFIEGAIVGRREDERGQMFKVAYELPGGEIRTRWFYPEELYLDEECDGGCCEARYVAAGNAALN